MNAVYERVEEVLFVSDSDRLYLKRYDYYRKVLFSLINSGGNGEALDLAGIVARNCGVKEVRTFIWRARR